MRVLCGDLAADDPIVDLAMAEAMLRTVAEGSAEQLLRLYRPRGPMAVFGRRDARLPTFGMAAEVARGAGFQPAVRVTGGKAVAYTSNALVLDVVKRRAADGVDDPIARFQTYGAQLVAAFAAMGIEAQLGAVPGEYCPGAHSINVRGAAKLVGTSQRVVRGAWLFSALIVLDDRERVSQVLADIYAALGEPFDPASVGSVADEAPGLALEEVERIILAGVAERGAERRAIDPELLDRARALAARVAPGAAAT